MATHGGPSIPLEILRPGGPGGPGDPASLPGFSACLLVVSRFSPMSSTSSLFVSIFTPTCLRLVSQLFVDCLLLHHLSRTSPPNVSYLLCPTSPLLVSPICFLLLPYLSPTSPLITCLQFHPYLSPACLPLVLLRIGPSSKCKRWKSKQSPSGRDNLQQQETWFHCSGCLPR